MPGLHEDKQVSISPSWLVVDNTRYPIRTIVRVEFNRFKPRLGWAYTFFFVGVALLPWSVYQFWNPTLPDSIPWAMLIASAGMCMTAAWIVFGARTRYRILVSLLDGGQVRINKSNTQEAEGVLNGLTKAMDWHRSPDILTESARPDRIRRRRATASGANSGSSQSGVDPQSGDANKAREAARRKARQLIPLIGALLKDRN